jgi:hypothetical protein
MLSGNPVTIGPYSGTIMLAMPTEIRVHFPPDPSGNMPAAQMMGSVTVLSGATTGTAPLVRGYNDKFIYASFRQALVPPLTVCVSLRHVGGNASVSTVTLTELVGTAEAGLVE